MTRTEQFNLIMQRVNAAHSEARKQKTQKFNTIKPRTNMNDLQTSLSKCTVSGNVVRLPEEILPNYQDVRKALLNAGATYKRNTFVFPNDALPYIDRLMDGESVNIKKEFQAFFTPPDIAQWMAANLFAEIQHSILEPSAGDGALIEALRNEGHKNTVFAFELNPIYQDKLKRDPSISLLGSDFLTIEPKWYGKFDRIIANPPFSKNQDIDHVYKMWECLAPKGRLISVMSKHWEFANGKKEKQFRAWLEPLEPDTYPLDSGRFKSSGTMVSSQIVVIDKP